MKYVYILCLLLVSNQVSAKWHKTQDSGHVNKWFDHSQGQLASKNFGNEIIYQIVVDRFSNGNSTNDCLHGGRFCSQNPTDFTKFQGGDIRGVINKLDYLKDLGVSRLWLTPIFENNLLVVDVPNSNQKITAYHGYWIKDWYRLNSFFTDQGSQDIAIVDELIEKSQRKSMKIYLDTVINHSSPKIDVSDDSLAFLDATFPLPPSQYPSSQLGVVYENGRYLTSYEEDVYRTAQNESDYRPFFHHFRNIRDGEWEDKFKLENFSMMGLADLSQHNSDFASYMKNVHEYWLDRGIAGFRIDTIKHVPHTYWKIFSRDLMASHPNAEHFGEFFNGGPYYSPSHKFFKETRISMIDFNFRDAVSDTLIGGASFSKFVELWKKDPVLGDAKTLITYLDSHDLPRLRNMGMSQKRMAQALVFLMTSRGVPCLYYGIEQDLFSNLGSGDPYNRPMMTSFDQNSIFYTLVKKLSKLRKENTALRYGDTHVIHETRNILAFERIHEGKKVFIVTSKNPIAGSDDFTIKGLSLTAGIYKDVLTGNNYRITKTGELLVSLADGDTIILQSK